MKSHIKYHKDGETLKEVYSTDGLWRKQGEYLSFYETGYVKEKTPYKNGKRNGLSVTFYENGNPKEMRLYEEGLDCGRLHVTYYENGQIQEEEKEGHYKKFDENGNLVDEYALVDFPTRKGLSERLEKINATMKLSSARAAARHQVIKDFREQTAEITKKFSKMGGR